MTMEDFYMLIVAHAEERQQHSKVFDQMYRLRAHQFAQRRGWRVVVRDGLEKDQFDDLNPLYICVVHRDGRVLASLRLLPTTGPHMLSEIFPEVAGDVGIIRHPLIWESSRFCVDTKASREYGADGVNIVTRELLAGLFETAQGAGMHYIVSVYDIFVERILRRAGCKFERLGSVIEYDDLKTVGGLFEVSTDVISAIRQSGDEQRKLMAA